MSHPGLDTVRRRIREAALAAGRDPAGITLIAVSKTFTAAEIEPAIAAGQLVFGENRVQEAKGKWPELKREVPNLELHLIGPLQSNKAGEAVALFDAIHTIDRPKIAEAIAAENAKQGRNPQLFVQVNTG
ncbi:MAG TPA: alanine racemase, partial [Aestuariivirga sp.]|nr:alanine racemase [Aestuariivirga sp.]